MPTFTPKNYQRSALDSVALYFRECQRMGDADYAFQEATKALWGRKSPFTPLSGDFSPEMPYFCLRVPTGGGKTFLAAKSVALVNSLLLQTEHSVILWLVPSKAIRDQTMEALKNRKHPLHAALREAGPVAVIDLDEAKALTRSTLDTNTVVIVATRQAFQVGNEDLRKVYENSGALMALFDGIAPEQRANLLPDEAGNVPYSLVNALRLRRPFVIVDEAHNSRTELSFGTLAKFNPSGILELTATPDTVTTPSNVLHSVSAVELKREQMIKLPILLETEPNAQKCLALAIDRRDQLDNLARAEEAGGARYLRPVVLLQSEARSSTRETRHADWVKNELVTNHHVPEAEIVIATGDERGLETLAAEYEGGIFSDKCPVKYVITQKALAEGWDCAFAYILVSLADLRSATAVEQLLGRILRQPDATWRETDALNRSYAYVVSKDFGETAAALRDSLVNSSGFNQEEAADFVAAGKSEQSNLDFKRGPRRVEFTPMTVPVSEQLDVSVLSPELKRKVSFSTKKKELEIKAPLSEAETTELQSAAVMEDTRDIIRQAGEYSRTKAVKVFHTASELGRAFYVPQMEVLIDDELRLFDEPEAIDYPWSLPLYTARPTPEQIAALGQAMRIRDGGLIDIDETRGEMTTRFVKDLQRDLTLSYVPENWTAAKLAAWFCRQIRDPSITHASKTAFVAEWLSKLLEVEGIDLARANQQKFLLRNLIDEQVTALRKEAIKTACANFLFGEGKEDRVRIGSGYTFEFHPDAYAPDRDYKGEYGSHDFENHYYPRIGDFDSKEEFLCACWIDRQPQIKFWVRNLVRKNGGSFFLQKADGRFFPDFICQLVDGRILAVEYKGKDRWNDAKPDREIGELWEELSEGKCLFVMVTEKNWPAISAKYLK
jgi:type III restriction enzyme